jgi:hypothetical protein
LLVALFLARTTMIRYAIGLRELFYWREIGKLALGSALASPILVAANHLPSRPVWAAIIAACLYLGAYGLAIKGLRVSGIDTFIKGLKQMLPKRQEKPAR